MPQEIIEVYPAYPDGDRRILVCQNTSCLERDSAKVLAAFRAEKLPSNIKVTASGCQGQCSVGATVRLVPDEVWYCRVKPQDVPMICDRLCRGEVVSEKLNPRIHQA